MLYPNRKAVVVFQPHLFSRTKDLADGFAEVLDMADEVMLLPIYPARELPVEGVTSQLISDRMRACETGHKVRLVEKEDVLKWVELNKGSMNKNVLVTAGAGDIDRMIEPIKKTLTV
jgi:UDP-N-acetylmuramate--alanine ligase